MIERERKKEIKRTRGRQKVRKRKKERVKERLVLAISIIKYFNKKQQ